MKVSHWIVACGAVLAVAAGATIANAAAVQTAATTSVSTEKPQPGVWLHHAVIIDLRNLPKRYTCDDLWYKFRDVLQAIDASPNMKILPYRCESSLGSAAYSPSVELVFSLPSEVSGRNARWADLQVVPKSVRLQPGTPSHLDKQDCALLKQMKDTLLRNIGATVTNFHLACNAPPSSSNPPFSMTVKALAPVGESPNRVAAASTANGHAGS